MSTPTSNKTKFWIICCDDTEATQKISQAVADWQLLGVRSLLAQQLSSTVAEAIAHADYVIFIAAHAQPSARIRISPLSSPTHQQRESLAASAVHEDNQIMHNPASLLANIYRHYGQSPQAWLFQLPTQEVRARRVQPVSTQISVAQALNQIEVFVRNYRLAISPRTLNKVMARHEMAAEKQLATA